MQDISDRKLAMAKWIVVDFDLSQDGGDIRHRIGNWADDIWAQLQDEQGAFVPLSDGDRPANKLSVAVVHSRDLKRIKAQIERLLDAHNLCSLAQVRIDLRTP